MEQQISKALGIKPMFLKCQVLFISLFLYMFTALIINVKLWGLNRDRFTQYNT